MSSVRLEKLISSVKEAFSRRDARLLDELNDGQFDRLKHIMCQLTDIELYKKTETGHTVLMLAVWYNLGENAAIVYNLDTDTIECEKLAPIHMSRGWTKIRAKKPYTIKREGLCYAAYDPQGKQIGAAIAEDHLQPLVDECNRLHEHLQRFKVTVT